MIIDVCGHEVYSTIVFHVDKVNRNRVVTISLPTERAVAINETLVQTRSNSSSRLSEQSEQARLAAAESHQAYSVLLLLCGGIGLEFFLVSHGVDD
jgi:hypothetical protein